VCCACEYILRTHDLLELDEISIGPAIRIMGAPVPSEVVPRAATMFYQPVALLATKSNIAFIDSVGPKSGNLGHKDHLHDPPGSMNILPSRFRHSKSLVASSMGIPIMVATCSVVDSGFLGVNQP
jgi:hypothetical protein